jgi:ribose transport system permease protein
MKKYMYNRVNIKTFLMENAVLILLFIFIAFMAATKPAFSKWDNITNILAEFTVYGVTACAMTTAIICAEFDLSASSVFAWSTVLFVSMTNMIGLLPAFIITIASGTIWGAINGWLVAKVKINAFVVTLGTMTFVKGLAFFYTNGEPINTSNETLRAIGAFNIFGISITPIAFAIVLAIFAFILKKTRFGRGIYATGGNYEVARLAGINVEFYKFIIFVILGICAALSAVLFCTRIQAGSALYGGDLSLYCVAATVIGGTSLSGGNGGVTRTLVGLLFMSVLFNALTLQGVQGYFQQLIRGIVLIAVIMLDAWANRK